MLITKFIRNFIKGGLFLLLLGIMFIIGISIYIHNAPRQSKLLNSYITAKFNKSSANYTISSAKATISLVQKKLHINISDIKIYDKQKTKRGSVASIHCHIDIMQLPKLESNIIVDSPKFSISSPSRKKAFSAKSHALPAFLHDIKLLISNGELTNIYPLKKAGDTYPSKETKLNIPNLQINLTQAYNRLNISIAANANIDNEPTHLAGTLNINRDQTYYSDWIFDNIPEIALFQILPLEYYLPNDELELQLNGELRLKGKLYGPIHEATGNINASKGKLGDDLLINSLSANFIAKENGAFLRLEDIIVAFEDGGSLKTSVTLNHNGTDNLKISVDANNITMLDIIRLWPNHFFVSIKAWLANHLQAGILTNLNGTLNANLSALDKEILPEDAINFTGQFKDLSLHYHDTYPLISKLHGTIKFDHESLQINGTQGHLSHSIISNLITKIPYKGDHTLKLHTILKGPITDLLLFSPKQYLDPHDISGEAVSDIYISFPLHSALSYGEMEFDIKSTLAISKMLIPAEYMPKFKIPHEYILKSPEAYGTFDGKSLSFTGNGTLLNDFLHFNWITNLQDEVSHHLSFNGNISSANINNLLDVSVFTLKSGQINTKAEIDILPLKTNFNIYWDAAKANYHIPILGFKKEIGAEGKGHIEGHLNEKSIVFDKLLLNGAGVDITGDLILDRTNSNLEHLNFSKIIVPKNNFQLNYKMAHNHEEMSIKGEKINFYPAFMKSSSNKNLAFSLNIDLAKIALNNIQKFRNLKLELDQDPNKIQKIIITAVDNQGNPVNLKLKHADSAIQELDCNIPNIASLLKAFHITDKFTHGDLKIEGIVTSDNTHRGIVELTDFTARNNSIVSHVVGLASTAGITNILKGSHDLKFNKLTADYRFIDNILYLYNGRIHGPSLDLTFYGTIDTKNKKVQMQGLVMPDIIFLNIIGKIPLIGTLLGGGRPGIIAASYKMQGPYNNIATSVNPFSLLKLGILRDLFHNKNECKELGLPDCK